MPLRSRTATWDDPAPTVRAAGEMAGLDLLRAMQEGSVPTPPVMATLGYRLESSEAGCTRFVLEPGEWHFNPMGVVHGGVVATILDTAMACAVHSMLPAGRAYTTLELKVNFVRAVTVEAGPVVAEGSVVHLGGRVATAEGRLTGADGRLYAHATTTCLLFAFPVSPSPPVAP